VTVPETPAASAPGAARDADCRTIDGIVAALYESVSGPADRPRDWARMRTLYAPHARLVPMWRDHTGALRREVLDLDGYRASREPIFAARDFHEREIARRVERYGCLAHAFSTYEAFDDPAAPPVLRGINSIQLAWDDGRWWVLSVAWLREGPLDPIPARYLASPPDAAPAEDATPAVA
jgi:hypothetical protein